MNANDRLWSAVEAGSVTRVKNALKAGARVNAEDEDGHIPLMSAAYLGHFDVVEVLLAAGADPDRWAQGCNPLERAATGGRREVFDFLRPLVSDATCQRVTEGDLRNGEKRRSRVSNKVVESFIEAAMMGKLDDLNAAVAANVNIDAIGSNGNAAIHYAAFYGRMPILERLLALGANVNVRVEDRGLGAAGSTPLTLVASGFFAGNRPSVIRCLLDAAADIDEADDNGMTALMHAVEDGMGFMDSVETLIAAGANVNAADKNGNTALMFAVSRNRQSFATRLREAGASERGLVNVHILQAARIGDTTALQRLLNEDGANPNHQMQRTTPLTLACTDGHAEAVRILIAAGANVNLSFKSDLSPLIRAAYGGHLEATQLLLDAGANVNAEVIGIGTALDYALLGITEKGESKPWDQVIQLLESAGTPQRNPTLRPKKK